MYILIINNYKKTHDICDLRVTKIAPHFIGTILVTCKSNKKKGSNYKLEPNCLYDSVADLSQLSLYSK